MRIYMIDRQHGRVIQTRAVGFCGRHAFNTSQKQSLIYDLETYLLLYGGCGDVITRCRRCDLLRQICSENKHDILILYNYWHIYSQNNNMNGAGTVRLLMRLAKIMTEMRE